MQAHRCPTRPHKVRTYIKLAATLVPLPVRRVCRAVVSGHHGKTSGMDTGVVRLSSSLLFFTLSTRPLALLSSTFGLLHFDFGAPLTVLCALIVEFVVLGCNFLSSGFAVTAAASTETVLAYTIIEPHGRSIVGENSPQLNVDLAALLLLAVREDRVVVLLQCCLHAVETVELNEASAHKLVGALVCAQTNLGRLDLGEVLLDLLLGRCVREIA
jgi:hypothetical protein